MSCRWGVNVGCMIITAALGEWLCVQRELQDIPLGQGELLQTSSWHCDKRTAYLVRDPAPDSYCRTPGSHEAYVLDLLACCSLLSLPLT